MVEVSAGHAVKARIGLFRSIRVLDPRLADLLEAIAIGAHSIKILGNGRMICVRHGEKIHERVSGVAGSYSYRQTLLRSVGPKGVQIFHVRSEERRVGKE